MRLSKNLLVFLSQHKRHKISFVLSVLHTLASFADEICVARRLYSDIIRLKVNNRLYNSRNAAASTRIESAAASTLRVNIRETRGRVRRNGIFGPVALLKSTDDARNVWTASSSVNFRQRGVPIAVCYCARPAYSLVDTNFSVSRAACPSTLLAIDTIRVSRLPYNTLYDI